MRSNHILLRSLALLLAGLAVLPLAAAEPDAAFSPITKPKNDKASASVLLADDPLTAMRKFRVAPGLKLDLVAAEPLIQNVVSFAFDERGRIYVVETHRRRTSVFDIRNHKSWVDADLSFRSVDDRVNFLKEHVTLKNEDFAKVLEGKRGGFGDFNHDGVIDWRDLEVESERIRLLTDFDANGHATRATTFADGFNTLVSGVAAGVLTRNGKVWFTCIPDLWLLEDEAGVAQASRRTSLHHGFGVHIAYGGHDMHGLRFGPDGKIYWSIADRGTRVVTREGKTISLPDTGAVFRCNPDGTEMEVVASGLRNPQELAFDEFGNLFTGDNNADGGDKARFEYIVEGADYGWRYGWQHLPKLGAWNSEMLWGLAASNTAAYLLPPVAHVTHGPAGLAYYPGTGMPERYNGHFFLADFPGGVRTFATQPRGASFTVENSGEYLQNNSPEKMEGKLLWNLYPVDVDFAPGGGAYVADWVAGWEKTGKGRLWRVHDPDAEAQPDALETKRVLAEGFERPVPELAGLLAHRDQRVRQGAQFALAEANTREVRRVGALEIRLGKDPAVQALIEVARDSKNQLARIHAIWGLAQIHHRNHETSLSDLRLLLQDADIEVRAQTAKIFGDEKYLPAINDLVKLVRDNSPRVRCLATLALGKLGNKEVLPAVVEMLCNNADADAYLRHAGVMAFVWIGDTKAILKAAKHEAPSVRLAALLAMRRLAMPEIAEFLNAREPQLVLEAARAINDGPIDAAMPVLAKWLERVTLPVFTDFPPLNEPAGTPHPYANFVLRRAINAAFRLGTATHAQSLVKLAQNTATPEAARAEALAALSDWVMPSGRDRVTGLWRPVPPRDGKVAATALAPVVESILSRANHAGDATRIAAINAVEKLEITHVGAALFELFLDTEQKSDVRVAALRALVATQDARLADAVKVAKTDRTEALRKEASHLAGRSGDLKSLSVSLERGSLGEKQAALQALGALEGEKVEAVLSHALDELLAGRLARELQLDLLEAANRHTSAALQTKVQQFNALRDPKDDLAKWRETLQGGDAKLGRQIFYERAEAGCFRCHKVNGEGGDVGPELAGLAAQKGRDYLLESIVYPNKQIAVGFETILVTLKSGGKFAGLVKGESGDELVLNSPEDGLIKLKKSDIVKRDQGASAMPEGMGEVLSKRDLRDLVEFLSTAR